MWYLFATWFVTLSIFCSSSRSWCIRQTSSIQSNDLGWSSVWLGVRDFFVWALWIFHLWGLHILLWIVPPLSNTVFYVDFSRESIFGLNSGCEVRVNFFLIIFKFLSFTPFIWRACRIASNHALSWAFCTSISCMVCLRTIRWSTVAHPLFPPAWALVIWTCCLTLSLIILA